MRQTTQTKRKWTMSDKYNKYNISKPRRCSNNNDCHNNWHNNIATISCTWVFNLLAVALLIQHVACVAQASEHVSVAATTTTSTIATTTTVESTTKAITEFPISSSFTPAVVLVKRHADNATTNNKKVHATHSSVEFGSRATSRRLNSIDAVGTSSTSSNTGDDGVNFAAYINDFNMQAEAAIPEDILDQQHIQDVDAIDADSMQYVGEGDIDGYAAVEPEADIILAAQKFSTSDGNREGEDGYRRHNNTNGSEQNKTSQKRNENVRRNARKRHKILGSGTDNGDDNKNNKFDNIYTGQMDELDELHHIDEEPFGLPSTQEEENFQLTAYPKEQQNLKLIAKGKEKNDDKGLGSGMTGQHRRFIEKFVGEKCNKALKQTANSDDTMKNNKDNNSDEDDGDIDDDAADADGDDAVADKQSQSSKINAVNKGNNLNEQINNNPEMEYTNDNQAEEKAIGDIEDKFRNEDENPTPQSQQEMLALTAMRNKDDVDDRKSVKFIAKNIKRHEKIQSASFAYVDDAADKNTKNYQYNNNKHTYKRHHYGELHDEIEKAVNSQAKSDSAEKVAMPKNQQLPQNIRHIDEVADSSSSSSSSSGNEMGLQADYSITYFGILANSSKKRDKTLPEDPAEMKELQSNSSENSTKTTEDVLKIADSDGAAKVEEVHATRNQRQQQKQQDSAPDEIYAVSESYPPHFSAFERYKAQRRNSRRYGHKMYKKKYKDYLSYATISSLTAGAMGTAIEATTTTTRVPPGVPGEPGVSLSAVVNATATSAKHTINSTQTKLTNNSYTDYYNTPELVQKRRQDEGQQQQQQHRTIDAARAQKHAEKLRKYARKIEAEKSRGLPASPIFVVGNRSGDSMRSTANTKPFYEGQINYYLETRDEEDMGGYGEDKENADTVLAREREERLRAHARSMERMIAADNNNWYRRVSPVLRNGIKALSNEGKHQHEDTADSQPLAIYKYQNYSHEQQQLEHQHQHQRIHHHQRNHYQQHHPHPHQHQHHRTHQHSHTHQHHDTHQHRRGSSNHHKHRQHGKHYQPTDTHQLQQQQQHHQSNAYQRKLPASALNPPSPHASATQAAIELGMVQTPIPPPSYTKQHQQQGGIGANGNGVQQLGHQITELEEFERYYAKWPHLARVQFQVYDEHYREAHPELYPELKDGTGADDADDDDDEDADEDYDDDYESAAELEEAQSGRDEDANLPPYIKKYNRRNKQLLNLLEGTLPPPTRTSPALMRSWSSSILQPGPHASSRSAGGGGMGRVRIDDDYLKEKRKRYHNRDISSTSSSSSLISGSSNNNRKEALQHYQDLFAQQRPPATTSSNIESVSKTAAVSANIEAVSTNQKAHNDADEASSAHDKVAQSTNQLPDEDVSISTDTDIDAYAADDGDVDIWPKEIENKSNANELAGNEQMAWQIEKLTTPNSLHDSHTTTVTPNAPKAAIFRLPSYPAIAGSFIGKPRSRSAQFAPSGGSRGKLAFVAPVVGDLHGNRWSNMYGRGGGSIGSFSDGSSSNGLAMAGNHHKSLSRFSAYKPTVHKTLTAAAGLPATSTTAPSYLWYAADEGLDTNNLATTTTAATVTPSGDGGDGEDAADAEGGAANAGVARTISSFVYHRVIDASPRLVGTGATVRKQRLPFVAITDRRLETTKKALLERQKDFEQNHYPMP